MYLRAWMRTNAGDYGVDDTSVSQLSLCVDTGLLHFICSRVIVAASPFHPQPKKALRKELWRAEQVRKERNAMKDYRLSPPHHHLRYTLADTISLFGTCGTGS